MEHLVFIKPAKEVTCYVVTQREGDKVRLLEVDFTPSVDCEKAVSLALGYDCDIRYDGSFFMEDGKFIRSRLQQSVFIYRPKGKLHDRVVEQAGWIKSHVIYRRDYADCRRFMRFIDLLTSYTPGDDLNTVAVDVLSDVSRYFRRIMATSSE